MTALVKTQYQWNPPSAIKRMDIIVTAAGEERARIFVRDEALAKVKALPRALEHHGFTESYADSFEGENVWVVSKFKEVDKLLNMLADEQFITARTPHSTQDFSDNEKIRSRQSLLRSLQRDTLKWSGNVGLTGHLAMMASGIAQRDWSRVISGPLSMVSPIVLGIYGNGKGAIKTDRIMREMHKHFSDKGDVLPITTSDDLEVEAHERINNFIGDNAIQVAFGTGALGAGAWVNSGFEEIKRARNPDTPASEKYAGLGRFLAGTAALMGDMIAVFIGEESKDSQKTGTQQSGGLIGWIRKNPMMAHGFLNFANNFLFLFDASQEKKKIDGWRSPDHTKAIDKQAGKVAELKRTTLTPEVAKNYIDAEKRLENLQYQHKLSNHWSGKASPIFSYVTAISFLGATTLSTLSSKHRHQDYVSEEAFEPLYAKLSASLLHAPEDERLPTLHKIADYLCGRDELKEGKITKETLIEKVAEKLTVMENSPWLQETKPRPRMNHQMRVAHRAVTSPAADMVRA